MSQNGANQNRTQNTQNSLFNSAILEHPDAMLCDCSIYRTDLFLMTVTTTQGSKQVSFLHGRKNILERVSYHLVDQNKPG